MSEKIYTMASYGDLRMRMIAYLDGDPKAQSNLMSLAELVASDLRSRRADTPASVFMVMLAKYIEANRNG